jgi:hypothetical protein
MLVMLTFVGEDDHERYVRDLVLMARRILGADTPVDVDEDDPARSMKRSSRRYIDAKIDVEACDNLAMTWWQDRSRLAWCRSVG